MDRGNVGNDRLRRCVIIAAPGSETSALARALGDRGVDCLLAQDIAPGGEISQEILKELAATDFVVASLHGETSPGLAFELGVAHALRKPMIAFTTNYDHLLDDLLGTYVVRKAPVASPEFADDIDRFLRHATPPPPVDRQPPSRPPADLAWARERAALLKVEGSADRGLALEQLVIELFEAAGDPIIHGKERPDRGVDLIAWDKEAGGSLIIECKHYSGGARSTVANLKHTVEKLEHMVLNSDARMALLVLSSDHPRQPERLPETPRVSIVCIETLIDALESGNLMAKIMHRRHNATPTRGMVGATS